MLPLHHTGDTRESQNGENTSARNRTRVFGGKCYLVIAVRHLYIKVVPGFEPGLLDSKSKVLTTGLYNLCHLSVYHNNLIYIAE